MESSNDSFLWADASNDSDDVERNNSIELMKSDYEAKSKPDAKAKQKALQTNFASDHEDSSKKKQKKTKKHNYSEDIQESSSNSQPERIKLEPESDIEILKESKLRKEENAHSDASNSTLNDNEYLNFRVKQEQSLCVETKKKRKHKKCNSNMDIACDPDASVDHSAYLDMQVKEEQVSGVEPHIGKSKKKKKHKKSAGCSDTEISREANDISEGTFQNITSTAAEEAKFSVIEEKFSADETFVEKPRKKKHKREHKDDRNGESNSLLMEINSEPTSDNINNNDLSLQPSDFTCNNIVSSTILNNSALELEEVPVTHSGSLRSKHVSAQKISDRIQFEEDDNSSLQESALGKHTARLNTLLKLNPHLKFSSLKTAQDSIITKDDEIWIVTWPQEMDLEQLKGATVLFDGKSKIKINGQTYDGVPNEDAHRITLVTQQCGQTFIGNLPVQHCMNYHKRIPKVHIPDSNIMVNNQTNFTPLPQTKCRHPLFGAHYKKAIKISSAVEKRLQAAKEQFSETTFNISNEKKRKKTKHKGVDIKMEQDTVCIEAEAEPVQKTRKRKHSQDDLVVSRKPKRIKHGADCPAAWESEKSIEENLFNF